MNASGWLITVASVLMISIVVVIAWDVWRESKRK